MFKTAALNHVANAYVDRDDSISQPGTRLVADDQNIKQQELVNVVEQSGQTLDSPGTFTNNNQISRAIQISSIGHIDGLIMSNATDTDHDIDVSDGACSFKDGAGNFRSFICLSVPTKKIDVDWVAGDDAGGFPSGLTLAVNTHYNYFLIAKDDGTVDAGFDTDAAAANLLADATAYDWYRRIGSVFTDASSNIRGFVFYPQSNLFLFKTGILDINDSSITVNVYETGTLTAPPSSIAKIAISGVSAREDVSVNIRSVADDMAVVGNFIGSTTTATVSSLQLSTVIDFPVNASSQLKYAFTTDNPTSIQIRTQGFFDARGRNL